MRKVERTALMPFSAQQMFDVVNDIESYSQYLPWCVASEVLEQSETQVVAKLDIARGGMRQSFTTRNELDAPHHMSMSLLEGPFSMLQGDWYFKQLGDEGCKVEMSLCFDFDNRLMNAALGQVFSVAADKLVDAFCARAESIYGG